jgi:hypothetical protein
MLYDPKWSPPEVKVNVETWQEALLQAADVLERDGWCQHHNYDNDGSRCMLGALGSVSYNYTTSAYGTAILKLQSSLAMRISEWNDATGRTKEEVIAKLRKIASYE